jgi:hypothetical protein
LTGGRYADIAWEQIADANDSIVANFAEGSSKDPARCLRPSPPFEGLAGRGRGRLKQVERRRSLTREELAPLEAEAETLGKMLGGFIKYLRASDFKNRGSFKCRSK